MDFMEAVKAMKEGKKIRRNNYPFGYKGYIELEEGHLQFCNCNENANAIIDFKDIEATDWEIYEEQDEWNLADELKKDGNELRYSIHFKTFIQKVKEDVMKKTDGTTNAIYHSTLWAILSKRAGDL